MSESVGEKNGKRKRTRKGTQERGEAGKEKEEGEGKRKTKEKQNLAQQQQQKKKKKTICTTAAS